MNQFKSRLSFILAISVVTFLCSCRPPTFINLTSKNLSQNPSGIYTLQTEVEIQDRKVLKDSIEVNVIVGGETIGMVQDPVNDSGVATINFRKASTKLLIIFRSTTPPDLITVDLNLVRSRVTSKSFN